MVSRACLECGAPSAKTRCPACTSLHESARPSRRIRGRYDTKWMRLRAAAIRMHPWCVDCHTPGTATNPLTGDHRLALANGGKNVMGNVVVRCRVCNSAKGDRHEPMGIGAFDL